MVSLWPTSRGCVRSLECSVEHGAAGTGEPLTCLLRKEDAGSDTVADHVSVVKSALVQLPGHRSRSRPERKALIRANGAVPVPRPSS
jgi:hypothetical protein